MVRIVSFTALLAAALPASTPAEEASTDREQRRSPVVQVFEKSRDAVVNISTTRIVQMRSLSVPSLWDDIFDFSPLRRNQAVHNIGSGVVVHPSGYVVTNAHVVSQASDVGVTFADGTTEPAEILAVDAEHDLAVLKLSVERPLAWQKLGRSDDIMVGESVVAIGNPLGLQHTVTAGIVSALDRDLVFNRDRVYRRLIQTDASINPGNSGGPLLNVSGELIGINTAIRGDAQNIGFAIPVDRLWELLPAMLDIERRERVKLGLRVGGPHAKVLHVQPGSPAADANLKTGDTIIRFNGEPVRDGIDYYVRLLEQEPGNEIRLAVQRGDAVVNASVPLEAIPLPDSVELAKHLLGLELEDVPRSFRRRYKLPEQLGVIVADVERGSPAERARFLPGDLIVRLDRVTTSSMTSVGLVLEHVRAGDRVTVDVLRVLTEDPFIDQVSVKTRQ